MNRSSRALFLLLLALVASQAVLAQAPPEPWAFRFDARNWQLGHQSAEGQTSLHEYFLPGESRRDWTEKVTSYFDPRKAEPKWLVGWMREDLVANCTDGKLEVLEESEDSVLLELRHQGCKDFIPLRELRRITAMLNGTLTLAFGERVENQQPEKRDLWLSILRDARPAGKTES